MGLGKENYHGMLFQTKTILLIFFAVDAKLASLDHLATTPIWRRPVALSSSTVRQAVPFSPTTMPTLSSLLIKTSGSVSGKRQEIC
jgi:hypothetical protein